MPFFGSLDYKLYIAFKYKYMLTDTGEENTEQESTQGDENVTRMCTCMFPFSQPANFTQPCMTDLVDG